MSNGSEGILGGGAFYKEQKGLRVFLNDDVLDIQMCE